MAYGSVGENYGAGVGGGVGGYGGYAPNGQPIGYGVPGSGGYSNPSVVSYGGIGPGFGGAAGISPYSPGIAGPPAAFQAPVYSNSMSNWLGGAAPSWEQSNITGSAAWNANENAQLADVRTLTPGGGLEVPGYQNSMFDAYFSSPFAIGVANSMGVDPATLTTGRSWGSDYVASGGNTYGLAGRGSSVFGPWDPQGTAYAEMYGPASQWQQGGRFGELGASNLGNMANYINSQGYFANPNAGQALASVAGAESAGDPWAVNPQSGATGMFQWMGPRLPAAQNALGADWSPQAQGSWAAAEMGQPQYGRSWATLNNPGASVGQMQNALINNFEGLQGYPSQVASDRAGASAYLPGIQQAGFQPTTGFHR